MSFLSSMTTGEKLLAAVVAGIAGLFLLMRGGSGVGSAEGVAVMDMRRPTDDANIPGAAWDSSGYSYMSEMSNSYNDLLRKIFDQRNPPGTIPPTPTTDGAGRAVRLGRGDYQLNPTTILHSRRGVLDNIIVRPDESYITRGQSSRNVWNQGRSLLGLDPVSVEAWRRSRQRPLPNAPVRNAGTPGPPTPFPAPGEVVQ